MTIKRESFIKVKARKVSRGAKTPTKTQVTAKCKKQIKTKQQNKQQKELCRKKQKHTARRFEMRKKIITFFGISMGVIIISTFIHERIHQEIMHIFGCNQIKTTFFKTICMENNYVFSVTEKLAHSINEIVGYTSAIIIAVMLLIFLLLLLNFERKSK